MPELRPIPKKRWIAEICGDSLTRYLPGWSRFTKRLPVEDIDPEHLVMEITIPVEFMVICLWHHAWIRGDWKPYVRYTIASRLLNRKDKIFSHNFDDVKDDFLQFQIEGGTFARQTKLRAAALAVLHNRRREPRDAAAARLILSTMDEIEDNTLIQPFHWIRSALSYTEEMSPFGMTMANSEMTRQKMTLCKILRH